MTGKTAGMLSPVADQSCVPRAPPPKGEHSEIDEAIWHGDGRLWSRRCLGTSVISAVVIGMGASLGREAAPKLLGGASASVFAGWAGLSVQQRRLLDACGGGAGLAAAYNVPLDGALFTAGILYGAVSLPVILPALACSCIATATAWIYLPAHATFGIPGYRFTASLLTWSLIAGPVIGVISSGYIRLIGWVSHYRATGTRSCMPGPGLRRPGHHQHLVPGIARERQGHGS